MKNKAFLSLLEQLTMVLTFSLAAAWCLLIFLRADQISQETARRDEAVFLAQNTAEALKAGISLPEATNGYRVEVQEEASPVPGLAKAKILVYYEGEECFSLTAGWQEELP